MKINEILVRENVGKKFKFNINGEDIITTVKGYYVCGYYKIVLDFIDEVEFEEVERKIDWNKVPQWTKVQTKANLDSEWNNMYFLNSECECDDEDYREYNATFRDEFTHKENRYGKFPFCRIHPNVKIQEEWYEDYIEEEDFESLQ